MTNKVRTSHWQQSNWPSHQVMPFRNLHFNSYSIKWLRGKICKDAPPLLLVPSRMGAEDVVAADGICPRGLFQLLDEGHFVEVSPIHGQDNVELLVKAMSKNDALNSAETEHFKVKAASSIVSSRCSYLNIFAPKKVWRMLTHFSFGFIHHDYVAYSDDTFLTILWSYLWLINHQNGESSPFLRWCGKWVSLRRTL